MQPSCQKQHLRAFGETSTLHTHLGTRLYGLLNPPGTTPGGDIISTTVLKGSSGQRRRVHVPSQLQKGQYDSFRPPANASSCWPRTSGIPSGDELPSRDAVSDCCSFSSRICLLNRVLIMQSFENRRSAPLTTQIKEPTIPTLHVLLSTPSPPCTTLSSK